jgi:thermitase
MNSWILTLLLAPWLITATSAEASSIEEVVVAMVDTGIDLQNKELAPNLWINAGESGQDRFGNDKATNGLDDDGNGYIDDVHGWDFVTNSPLPQDRHGHGSHVSGLVLSQMSQKDRPKVRLMILKYYDQAFTATDTLKNTIQAFEYATRMGAHIINYSGGGPEGNRGEFLSLSKAREKGLLVVAAAGNEGADLAQRKFFPASYGLDHILSVTAIDGLHHVLPTSNYSPTYVHLAAPGKNQISWLLESHLGPMTGTSQATALATGAAAAFLIERPELKNHPANIIRFLRAGADYENSLDGKVQNSAQLNIEVPPRLRDSGETPFGSPLFGRTASRIEEPFKNLGDKN